MNKQVFIHLLLSVILINLSASILTLGSLDENSDDTDSSTDQHINMETNPDPKTDNTDSGDNVEVDQEKLEYTKGSVCAYCKYCKFCKLCDKDCPCETSASKPNCHLCKYCKYCKFCSAICDTVCKPGGYVDTISAAIINSLPSFDKSSVDQDINSAKKWIDNKDEL